MNQTKFQEPFRPVLLNLSLKVIEQLDTQANLLGRTRSDVMRKLLDKGLHETNTAKRQTRATGGAVGAFNSHQCTE